ncbi:MAG: methyl-accepting chemotaxis protein [Oligoflexales bacterium]
MKKSQPIYVLLSTCWLMATVMLLTLSSSISGFFTRKQEFNFYLNALERLNAAVTSLETRNLQVFLAEIIKNTVVLDSSIVIMMIFFNVLVLIGLSYVIYNFFYHKQYQLEIAIPNIDEMLQSKEIGINNEDYSKQKQFTTAINDLKNATDALAKMVGKGSIAEIEGDLARFELHYNRIIQIAASGNLICNEIKGIHKSLSKVSQRLQRLAHQCRGSANFSATTQLEWKRNIMINNLRQVKESHDKVQDTANHICSIHKASQRLIREIFEVEKIYNERNQKVSVHLATIQEGSKSGFKEVDHMVTSVSNMKDLATGASNLVSGLTQRSEAIMSLVHIIGDLAEQINLQALNASVEAAKLGNQGIGFAEIAERLCKLTSRSSVNCQSITELLSTIQDETNKAGSQLGLVCEAIEQAFASVSQCGNTYRKAVSETKYAASELHLLENEFTIHLNKLQEVNKMGDHSTKFFEKLTHLLASDDKMSNRINEETNKLTAHSDRLSTLLAKQFHELNHCEKMLLDGMHLMHELENQAAENKHATLSLRAALEEIDTSESAIPLDDKSQRIASRHLTLLKNSTETLEHLRLPPQVLN